MNGFKALTVIILCMFTASAYATKKPLCQTQILVTTPQTASFYAKSISNQGFMGNAITGTWLRDTKHCMNGEHVVATVWDLQGRALHFKSKEKINNVSRVVTLQYPRDFKFAPKTMPQVMCRAQLMNFSRGKVAFYAGKVSASNRLATLDPWEKIYVPVPCFKQKQVIAAIPERKGKQVAIHHYLSKKRYTDINTVATVTFPNEFTQAQDKIVPYIKYASLLYGITV